MDQRTGQGIEQAEVHTLIGAYALDALDEGERADFERHLEACETCRDEVVGLRSTAVRLADAVAVPPPQRVRDRVLAQVAVTSQAREVVTPIGAAPSAQPLVRRVWLVAAAVLAVLTLGTGVTAWSQYRSAQDARAFADGITRVLADPSARQVQAPVTGGGAARLVVAGDHAVLAGGSLAALPADRAYQLWIIRGEQITSAGLGPAGSAGAGEWVRPVEGVRRGDLVAVSVEPTGGSSQPTTTPIVALKV